MAARRRLKLAALDHYGGRLCTCCKEPTMAFLGLDHINNDGRAQRLLYGHGTPFYARLRTLGWPQELALRVLCHNCNLGRAANGGTCPHGNGI